MSGRSFYRFFQKSNRSFAYYQYEQMLGNHSFAHLLNRSPLIFRRAIVWLLAQSLFKKSEWAIALFFALCKRAKEGSLLCRSFEKREWAIALFVALFKRATKRVIALSRKWAEKRAIAHFQNERMPNPASYPWLCGTHFLWKLLTKMCLPFTWNYCKSLLTQLGYKEYTVRIKNFELKIGCNTTKINIPCSLLIK